MAQSEGMLSKAEARTLLRRAGVEPDQVEGALAELPDPFDVSHEEAVLARHGLTRGHLMDSMGGSP